MSLIYHICLLPRRPPPLSVFSSIESFLPGRPSGHWRPPSPARDWGELLCLELMISEIHWTKPTRFNRITQIIECYIICRCNKKCYKHPRSFFSLLVQPRILLLAITFSYTGFHVSISMHLYFDMFLYLYLGTITGILCLTDYHLQLALLSSVFATSVGFFQHIGAHRSKLKTAT